jgi:ADP-ribosylglycohydrolase
MIGAIAGDVIGSVYEARPIKTTDFPLFVEHSTFTDDTVLTVAVAHAILHDVDYAASLRRFGRRYPHAGYGGSFYQWLMINDQGPYNSWGNGSAMRASPVGWAYDDAETVLVEAEASAAVTHNHPEGIKGAQAAALAVFLARTGAAKETIRERIAGAFRYDLGRTVDQIRPTYRFDVSCQGTVPEAIIAFLDASGYEEAVRLAISLGGDSDTLACIAGSIAHAYYQSVPEQIASTVMKKLPDEFRDVVDEFNARYGVT